MLVLPTKKADAFDTTKPLTAFLRKEYANEASKYDESMSSFQKIRNNAIFVNGSSGQLGFHNILRYNYHMKSIAKRLSGYESEIKFAFGWADSFNPSKRTVSASLHHDWACVMWNLASLETNRGTHVDRSSNEGIRAASLHFQQAAGIFSLLKNEIIPKIQGVKSEELCDGFLNVLQDLNLAQAQICFYEKAVRDRKAGTMKAGLVAKLAKQVAKFYEQAVAQSRDKEVTRCLDKAWIHHMDFQRECFQGAAEYWQAQSVKDDALASGQGFGEEITRLARAEEIFNSTIALGKSKRVHVATLSTAETFLDAVKRLKFTAVKDNETIYHDKVPEKGALTEVVPIAMVKPAPLPSYPTNPNVAPEPPLFADVLPKEVRSLLTTYRERVASVVSQTESIATKATNDGRAGLSAIGLPGSLEVYKSGGSFPSNLWKKIQNVQARGVNGGAGGLAADLTAKVEDLERLAARARTTIDSIEYSMRREESMDKSFRERFPNYTVPPSTELNGDIRRNVDLMLQAHEIAKSNDQTMIDRVNGLEFKEFLHLLGMSLPELEAQLPRDSSSDSSGSLVNTAELEDHLVKIATLFETREKALAHLKSHVGDHETAATEAFIDSSLGRDASADAVDELINAQLVALEPLTGTVTSTLAEQQQLLEAVIRANDAFNDARTNDPLQKERERIIKQLEQGISAYSQSQSQLTAGSTFYMDMQSRLTSLMQQCDDLSYTQQLQRQEFEVDSVRNQDRDCQVESDHDMALRLAEEMDRMNTTPGPNNDTPPSGQQQQQQQPQYGYPQLQQQQQQPPQTQQQQQYKNPPPVKPPKPDKMDVTYGQPVSGPPSSSVQQPLQPMSSQQQPQQQPPSHAYASHFQSSSQQPQQQHVQQSQQQVQQTQQPATSSYVYNAGFDSQGGGGGSGSAVSVSAAPQQTHQYHESNPFNPPQHQQQQQNYQQYMQQPSQQQAQHQGQGQYQTQSQQQYQQQQYQQPPPQQPHYQQPSQQPQYQQQQFQPSHPQGMAAQGTVQVQADENKVARLMEMGFPRESVVSYLVANSNNEEAALNGLLSGTALPTPPPPNNNPNNNNGQGQGQGQGQPPPASSDNSATSGFFSKIWGS